MTFADKVKIFRERMNVSQERLAVMLGVSFATVNRWEKGHSKPNYMALEKFHQICKECGIVFESEDNQ